MSRVAAAWGRLVIPIAAIALSGTLSACSSARVPMPSEDATPEQVVQAYAAAVHAGDCETARALVVSDTQSSCGIFDITAMTVTGRTQERRQTVAGEGLMIERVWVTLTKKGSPAPFPDGEQKWSYLLDRIGPHGAWRIYDQGMG